MRIPSLIENNKKYYAIHSEMALLNAQAVLDHIQKMAGIEACAYNEKEKKPSDEDLWVHPVMIFLDKAKTSEVKAEKVQYVIERLCSYFPFMNIMAQFQREYDNEHNKTNRLEVNANDMYDALNKIFRVLKKYRDYSAHYKFEDNCFIDGCAFLRYSEQPLASMVRKYYDVALRNIKEKYNYKTEELAFIQNKRYKITKGIDGRKKTVGNPNFFLTLTSNNGDTTNKWHLSGVGVALLISLFLDKQYVNLFWTRLPIFSDNRLKEEERRVIIRSMGINSVKLPKDRIHMDKDDMSVAMDMLNELKRCPDELFDILPAEKQAHFRIISSDHNEVLMKRSTDRFTSMLLQYIDYGKKFKQIRFHVNMGKLRYLLNAEKNCIDGNIRTRVIEHPLNGYGRIDEIEELRKNEDMTYADTGIRIKDFESMTRDDSDTANYPYVVDTYTHYLLENNKVEFSFCGNSSLPEVSERNGKWYVSKEVPACRMSILELPAMAFHMLLLGSEKTEARIKSVYDNYCRLFEAMRKGQVSMDNLSDFGIAQEDIPQRVMNCINGSGQGKDLVGFISRKLEAMSEDTRYRLERLSEDRKAIGSRDNKMGKRGYRQIRTGVFADFLAKDIVLLQLAGNNGANKMTGLNYRVMQSSIATYDSHGDIETKKEFKALFERANLLVCNPKSGHPFLFKVFARSIPENAIEFYERYLYERQAYLDGLRIKIAKGKTPDVPFVNKNQMKWKSPAQEDLSLSYTDNLAIELPRQMFDADIKDCLMRMDKMKDVDFSKANVTYLIAEYMHRVLNDDFQPFYGWERNYPFIDMLRLKTDKKGSLCASFTSVDERAELWKRRDELMDAYRLWVVRNSGRKGMSRDEAEECADRRLVSSRNEYQKTEKVIRRYKVQDALLFLMAKDVMTKYAEYDGDMFSLKEIMPNSDKGILSVIMPMTFTFEKNGEKITIKSSGMKLKNFGDFFPLANDRRLINLSRLIGTNTISKEDLEEEFKNYDQCRPEMASLILDIEKYAFDMYPQLEKKLNSTNNKVQFKDILQALKQDAKIDDAKGNVLRLIRNAFEHNNYPDKGVVEISTLPEVARELKAVFEKYTICK